MTTTTTSVSGCNSLFKFKKFNTNILDIKFILEQIMYSIKTEYKNSKEVVSFVNLLVNHLFAKDNLLNDSNVSIVTFNEEYFQVSDENIIWLDISFKSELDNVLSIIKNGFSLYCDISLRKRGMNYIITVDFPS